MNNNTADQSRNRYDEYRTFERELETRGDALSNLRPGDSEAIKRIGRLFTEMRRSRDLSHQEISESSGVATGVLQLLEQGLLPPDELTSEFLGRIGGSLASGTDHLVDSRGGVFASIAGSILEAGRWAGSESAVSEVDRLIESLSPQSEDSVREEAAWSLGEHILDPRAIEALVGALSDAFPLARFAALESLAPVSDDAEIRSVLVGRLADANQVVRSRAVEIVSGSMSESQSSLGRALSKLTATTKEVSEDVLGRLRRALALVPSVSIGIQLRPSLEGAASQSVIGVGIESEYYNADLIMIGDYPEFGLVLGLTFEDASAWAGHSVRVQLASDVEDELSAAGWRMEWAGFGPDVIDSETPVSAFGRFEMALGRASRPRHGGESDSQHNSLESFVKVIARALDHQDAISRLESVKQG